MTRCLRDSVEGSVVLGTVCLLQDARTVIGENSRWCGLRQEMLLLLASRMSLHRFLNPFGNTVMLSKSLLHA